MLISEPPGLPDAEANANWVVMLHGYNVAARAARGWHAETFKRLRALGSNARFIGLTWNGDTGLDYHAAVFQAFLTGEGLPRALRFIDESRTTLVAHSLGNIVACQGVQAGFTPAHYFLLNAALPIEAIAGETATRTYAADMTEASWRAYPRRLYAAEWSKLHPVGRQRRGYAWPGCFSRVRHLRDAINCFSAGEDVTNCPPAVSNASVLATLWEGRAVDYGVWKTQELLKGVGWTRSLGAAAMARSQGGWGFNSAWRGAFVPSGPDRTLGGRFELLSPAVAARIYGRSAAHASFLPAFRTTLAAHADNRDCLTAHRGAQGALRSSRTGPAGAQPGRRLDTDATDGRAGRDDELRPGNPRASDRRRMAHGRTSFASDARTLAA